MKAVRFDRYGGIDVLNVNDVPVPEPVQGEVQLKVKAASINPGEAKIREGLLHALWPATFPSGERERPRRDRHEDRTWRFRNCGRR